MPSRTTIRTCTCIAALAGLAGAAAGQSSQRAAFVANNGNLEGSVTSFTFSPAGVPQFVSKFITGANDAGTNAYAITLSPNGRYLATTHTTAASINERITIMRVNADATLSLIGTFTTPDSPLDAVWLSDSVLAVTLTNLSQDDEVLVYHFDEAGPTLTEIDSELTGNFTAYLEPSPDRQWLIAADSTGLTLRAFRIELDGRLTPGPTLGTSTYVLDPGFTRGGRVRLYGGGGISAGSEAIPAYDFNPADGSFTVVPESPFFSPTSNSSPKLAVASSDGQFIIIGHGSSSEVRTFSYEEPTGALINTGFAFDVGIQGDLGDVAVLDELVLCTDSYSGVNSGLYSFRIEPSGALTMNGGLVNTQGMTPRSIAVWSPPPSCYANCDGSTGTPALTANDFQCFIDAYAANLPSANCDGSTGTPALTANDFQCFINTFAAGCS